MRTAGLMAIDTVVESKAVLIKSKHPSNQELVDKVASRIRGVIGKRPSAVWRLARLTGGDSCTTICSLSVQHPSTPPRYSHQDHAGQASPDHNPIGHCGLGGGQ